MKNNRVRILTTLLFGVIFTVTAGAVLYLLKQDKESMNISWLMTVCLFSILITGGNLTVLITKRIEGRSKQSNKK
ncbi:hypothetical protein [Paenibacillus sp. JJ-223]|uniref:hypothetical protein n=1 Tax=Paenibacillus sp. JJ-223 TaxID=2905647 RepID=UPI001F227B58|nr:hypothetical protein [Paenibacillus sp. JJ-223]CAH1211365.1 hypothetical protein PAECIP111890_03711 [Paenibacillus sp. JJ-223]